MESSESYNFSLFRPRNLHGKKNRNIILSMLSIWALAVFGFQFLLRAIEKPVPEQSLVTFEQLWPHARSGQISLSEAPSLLKTILHARGKGMLNTEEKDVLSNAISTFTNSLLSEEVRIKVFSAVKEMESLRMAIQNQKDQEFLDTRVKIGNLSDEVIELTSQYTGLVKGSLESSIFVYSLRSDFPGSMSDSAFESLDDIMKLYMTHNRSVLTDTTFIGFPFHYFYTAVLLLILFVSLCIIYNVLVEWRLRKEGVVE